MLKNTLNCIMSYQATRRLQNRNLTLKKSIFLEIKFLKVLDFLSWFTSCIKSLSLESSFNEMKSENANAEKFHMETNYNYKNVG